MPVPRPPGHTTVVPFLLNEQMDKLIDFATKALDAEELYRLTDDNGKIWHAQLRIGDSVIMAGDTMGEHRPTPMNLYLYVYDADVAYQKAIQAGAQSVAEPSQQFYGDRVAAVKDFAGNTWWLANHQEDVSYDDMTQRARELAEKRKAG